MGLSLVRVFQYFLLLILSAGAFSTKVYRIKDRIYATLDSQNGCFRIVDATRQVGCQSAPEGSYGVLHWLDDERNATYILKDPGKRRPYVVAMDSRLFRNVAFVKRLYDSGKLSGIIVFHSDRPGDFSFSEDIECPNENTGLYKNDDQYGSCKKQKWNANATGYRFMDFKIPIFLIHNKTEKDILKKDCYLTYNQPMFGNPPKYPLCAVELLLFNHAAGTATRCRRRNSLWAGMDAPATVCDPLSGRNVYTFMPPTNKNSELTNKAVFMLASRMDSFSMFSDYSPGAESSLGNVIMMLAIAEALGRSRDFIAAQSATTKRYLMPVFFDGESLDYIGSSRLIYDMQRSEFPYKYLDHFQDQPAHLALSHLYFILELNQVVRPGKDGYSFHVDPVSMTRGTNNTVMDVVQKLRASAPGVLNPNTNFDMPLPPASVQRFLLADRSIPALVITDHEQGFKNLHYDSFTDVPDDRINRAEVITKMVSLSNAVVKLMLDWVGNGAALPTSDWTVNASVVQRLMDCFWNQDHTCAMFERLNYVISGSWSDPGIAFKRTYIGSATWQLIEYTLASFVGERVRIVNASLGCNATTFNQTGRTGEVSDIR